MIKFQVNHDPKNAPAIGARWDDASQSSRFLQAKQLGLLDYAEVNFPISPAENPLDLGLPILAHTSNNPLCSIEGLDLAVTSKVKSGADLTDSPWIGEHLAWLGFAPSGALGYILNPVFSQEFAQVACANINALRAYYGRPIALELGPLYNYTGDFKSELDFLNEVARQTDSKIILDVTHWMISNMNLQRPLDFGLSDLDFNRVIEIHVAGMRKGSSSHHWHDAHALAPSLEVLEMVKVIARSCKGLQAITLEHAIEGKENEFYSALSSLKQAVA